MKRNRVEEQQQTKESNPQSLNFELQLNEWTDIETILKQPSIKLILNQEMNYVDDKIYSEMVYVDTVKEFFDKIFCIEESCTPNQLHNPLEIKDGGIVCWKYTDKNNQAINYLTMYGCTKEELEQVREYWENKN